jgi:hypothetical protein
VDCFLDGAKADEGPHTDSLGSRSCRFRRPLSRPDRSRRS